MTKTLFATLLAATVAVTSLTVTPARAGGNDLAKALLGIAAIGLVVSTVNNANKRAATVRQAQVSRNRQVQVSRNAEAARQARLARNARTYNTYRRNDDDDEHANRRASRRHVHKNKRAYGARQYRSNVVPARCVSTFNTEYGVRAGVIPSCVAERAPRVALPDQCRRVLWTDRGKREVFGRQCLKTNGFEIS